MKYTQFIQAEKFRGGVTPEISMKKVLLFLQGMYILYETEGNPEMNKIRYTYGSWKGILRSINKDGVKIIETVEYSLLFIFDGVSSSLNAKEGVEKVSVFCEEQHRMYSRDHGYDLRALIEDMNFFLIKSGLKSAETTCCILYLPHERSIRPKITHLGDSRIYAVSEKSFRCLTTDDNDPVFRNMLTKYLGNPSLADSDFYESEVDEIPVRFLLCTDGFYNLMDEDTVRYREILRGDLDLVKARIESAVRSENQDDATFLLVELPSV